MKRTDAIILARGGSKGIPKKNIIDFCGKPLIAWTIENCIDSAAIDNVWVSSDDPEILEVAESYGAQLIKRPLNLSEDNSSSESGWKHGIDYIQNVSSKPEIIVAPQVTSPVRQAKDIQNAVNLFIQNDYDSMLAASKVEDLVFWSLNQSGELESTDYDYPNHQRHDVSTKVIDTGSFYIFKPSVLENYGSRIGGKLGYYELEMWKMFEIDNPKDLDFCAAIMKEYILES